MNPISLPQFGGDAGTMQTLTLMRQMVESSYLHPWIRERAAVLASPCARDRYCEHQTLTDFVRSNVSYISDPLTTEVLADPVTFFEGRLRTGRPAFGDCAQMVSYLCSLLKSIGHNPKFKVIGDRSDLSHVFVLCEDQELDPTMSSGVPDYYERFMLVDT